MANSYVFINRYRALICWFILNLLVFSTYIILLLVSPSVESSVNREFLPSSITNVSLGSRTQDTFSNTLKILVPFYNPSLAKLEKCLRSIAGQNMNEYDVCLVDDASTKNVEKLHAIMDKYCAKNPNWTKIIKTSNSGTLHSNVMAINKLNPKDMDVLVIIDGDDQLLGVDVFSYLRSIYKDRNIMLTFGGAFHRKIRCIEAQIHPDCHEFLWDFKKFVTKNSWRNTPYITSHLKTFRYTLFKRINHDDLMRNGSYMRSATDMATMIPMVEMAGDRFKCIEKPLYIYNYDVPNSHHNTHKTKQTQISNEVFIRSKQRYEPIWEYTREPHAYILRYNGTNSIEYHGTRTCVTEPSYT
eukprot:1139791_1